MILSRLQQNGSPPTGHRFSRINRESIICAPQDKGSQRTLHCPAWNHVISQYTDIHSITKQTGSKRALYCLLGTTYFYNILISILLQSELVPNVSSFCTLGTFLLQNYWLPVHCTPLNQTDDWPAWRNACGFAKNI